MHEWGVHSSKVKCFLWHRCSVHIIIICHKLYLHYNYIYIIISTHAYLQIWVALIWLSQKICKNVQYKRTFMFWSYLLCCKHLNEAEQPWLNGNDAHLYLICWVWNRCIHTLRLDTVFLWGLTGESAHALFISGNQFLHKLKKLKPSSK